MAYLNRNVAAGMFLAAKLDRAYRYREGLSGAPSGGPCKLRSFNQSLSWQKESRLRPRVAGPGIAPEGLAKGNDIREPI